MMSTVEAPTSIAITPVSTSMLTSTSFRVKFKMAPPIPWRLINRRVTSSSYRFLSTTNPKPAEHKDRIHPNVEEHRDFQKSKPDNPHFTSTTSTIENEMPSLGEDKPPPDMISSVDPEYAPKDRLPENTERMTGGTQSGNPDNVSMSDLDVGEMQGATFKITPLRRIGEDPTTMRARLLYQSRKRGILESDLLLSTFAAEHLPTMTKPQLEQYDLFLDENDWDIYYWATQSSAENELISKVTTTQETDVWRQGKPRSGEWAQTVGAFKPAYRPVPQRWKNSEILNMLRLHVRERSGGSVVDNLSNTKPQGRGLGRMPEVQVFD